MVVITVNYGSVITASNASVELSCIVVMVMIMFATSSAFAESCTTILLLFMSPFRYLFQKRLRSSWTAPHQREVHRKRRRKVIHAEEDDTVDNILQEYVNHSVITTNLLAQCINTANCLISRCLVNNSISRAVLIMAC